MATASSPSTSSHGSDGGGEDSGRPSRVLSQCDKLVTVNTATKRKGRKGNSLDRLKKMQKQSVNGKISIEFDTMDKTYKAVGKHAALFNNAVGLHTRNLLVPYYFRWLDHPLGDRVRIWERMFDMFDMEDCPENREAVWRQSRSSLKDWKHDLKGHYNKMCKEHGPSEAKTTVPDSVKTLQDWQRYIEHITSDKFQALSSKQKGNYGKKKTKSTQGSMSFAAHRHSKKDAEGNIQSAIDNYEAQHRHGQHWTSTEAKRRHEMMSEARQTQLTQDPTQRRSNTQIVNDVLGGDYGSSHGIGRKLKKSVTYGDVYHGQASTSQTKQPPPSQWDTLFGNPDTLYTFMKQMHQSLVSLKTMMQTIDPQFSNVPVPAWPFPNLDLSAPGSQTVHLPVSVPSSTATSSSDDDADMVDSEDTELDP